MPHVVALLFILAALPRVPPSGPLVPERSLTVIIQTGNSDIPEAVSAELKREFSKILSTSGYTFGWRNAATLSPGDTFDDLVLIKFEGACRSDSAVIPYDERGPLGIASRQSASRSRIAESTISRVCGLCLCSNK